MNTHELTLVIANNVESFLAERPESFVSITDKSDVSTVLTIAKSAQARGDAIFAAFASMSIPASENDDKLLENLIRSVCRLEHHRFDAIFAPFFEEFHKRKKSVLSTNMLIDFRARADKILDAWNLAFKTPFKTLSCSSFSALAGMIDGAFRHMAEDKASVEEQTMVTCVDRGAKERSFVYSLMQCFSKKQTPGSVYEKSLLHCGVVLETYYVNNKDYTHALEIAKGAKFPENEIDELQKSANSGQMFVSLREKALAYGVFYGSTVVLYGFYIHLLRGTSFNESVGLFSSYAILPLVVGAYFLFLAARPKNIYKQPMRWVNTRRTWLFFLLLMPLCPMWIGLVLGVVFFFLSIKFVPSYLIWRFCETMPEDLEHFADKLVDSIENSGGAE